MQDKCRAKILAIGTAVPVYQASQVAVGRWMADSFKERPALGRWLKKLYGNSGIETRYACIPDFLDSPDDSRLAPGQQAARTLTTAERMAIYERESVILGYKAAQQALLGYSQATNHDLAAVIASVTHVIAVSCTGFFAPGLDLMLARRLSLPATVKRTLIGFMGCAAAFNGLRAAAEIVNNQPKARVLVVCVELCSIHIQPGPDLENLISAALFADGAAACLVGNSDHGQGDFFELDSFHTDVKPETNSEMIWQIGNHGFTLRLSPKIPEHLAQIAPTALKMLWGNHSWPGFWAIHPGGRAIIDRLTDIFALAPEQVIASRTVLRRYGNLSSATILFVLEELRHQLRDQARIDQRIEGVAMAFGPGLVIEMARLIYVPPIP